MAGETKIEGIVDWVNLRKEKLRRLLNWAKKFPTYNVHTRVLSHCDQKARSKSNSTSDSECQVQ